MKIISYLLDWWKARHTGFIKQEEDERDYEYVVSGDSLPVKVDLRSDLSTIRNQTSSEACTGFAVAGLVEYFLNKEYGTNRVVSPLHLWSRSKEYHGYPLKNKGVWLRYSLDSLFKNGFVYEKNVPFNNDYLRVVPLGKTYIVESITKLLLEMFSYQLITDNDGVKDSLNKGRPVVFGLELNNSFYGNKDGVIKNVQGNGAYHAMLVVGYDDSKGVFIVRNSWGNRWGDSGYCLVPYDYFEEHSIDKWTIDYKR